MHSLSPNRKRGSPMKSQKPPFLTVASSGDCSLHQYSSDKAAELGDLWSRIADLDLAQAALQRLLRLDEGSDIALDASLYCAAAISYRRCFSSGVRTRLRLEIDANLDTEMRAAHGLLLATANKHLAHSVNPFEECKVTLALRRVEGQPVQVMGVTPNLVRLGSHNKGQLERFSALISRVRAMFLEQLSELGSEVATEAAQVPIEELLTLPPVEFAAIDDATANKRR